MDSGKLARQLSNFALIMALGAIVIAAGGMTLARFDVIEKIAGFQAFLYMIPVAGIAALFAVFALVLNMRTGWPAGMKAAMALVIGGGSALAATMAMSAASTVPAIHDISTDLDNPPEFAALELPENNLRGVESVDKWKELHRDGYGNLEGIVLEATPAEVVQRAALLAREKGWKVEVAEPETGRLEAVAYASYIRFEDIVVLRAETIEDGRSLVDMRSVSRVGISDLGVNAERIREFLAALQAAG
ncbi:DUF1499 domain-containing protein [Qipengyuania sp. CAU 1752]